MPETTTLNWSPEAEQSVIGALLLDIGAELLKAGKIFFAEKRRNQNGSMSFRLGDEASDMLFRISGDAMDRVEDFTVILVCLGDINKIFQLRHAVDGAVMDCPAVKFGSHKN